MIFEARYGEASYATVVIRAKDAHEAWLLAVECGTHAGEASSRP